MNGTTDEKYTAKLARIEMVFNAILPYAERAEKRLLTDVSADTGIVRSTCWNYVQMLLFAGRLIRLGPSRYVTPDHPLAADAPSKNIQDRNPFVGPVPHREVPEPNCIPSVRDKLMGRRA